MLQDSSEKLDINPINYDLEELRKRVEEDFDSFDLFRIKKADLMDFNRLDSAFCKKLEEIGADHFIRYASKANVGRAITLWQNISKEKKRIRKTNFIQQMMLLDLTSLKNQEKVLREYYLKKQKEKKEEKKELKERKYEKSKPILEEYYWGREPLPKIIDQKNFFTVLEVINAKREQNFFNKLKQDFEKIIPDKRKGKKIKQIRVFEPQFAFIFYKVYLAGQNLMESRISELITQMGKETQEELKKNIEEKKSAIDVYNKRIKVCLDVLEVYRKATNFFALHSIKYFQELNQNMSELIKKTKGKKKNLLQMFVDQKKSLYYRGKFSYTEIIGRKKVEFLQKYADSIPKGWKMNASFLEDLLEKKIIMLSNVRILETEILDFNYKKKYVWELIPVLYKLFGTLRGKEIALEEEEFDKALSQYLFRKDKFGNTIQVLTVSRLLYPLLYKEDIVKPIEQKLKRDFIFLLFYFFIIRVFWKVNRNSTIIKFEENTPPHITI